MENKLGEAPASANTRIKNAKGFSYQFTLRAENGTKLLDMLSKFEDSVLAAGWTPDGYRPTSTPGGNGSNGHTPTKPCPIHTGATMYEKTNAKGSWFSHKVAEGEYCNGRPKDFSAPGAF